MSETNEQKPLDPAGLFSPAVMALPQFSFQVEIWIDPSNLDAWFEAARPAFQAVTKEKELIYFEMFQDPDDPGHLSWIENWSQTVEWLVTTQLSKEYYRPYLAATEHMFVKPRSIKVLKRFGGSWVHQKQQNFEQVD